MCRGWSGASGAMARILEGKELIADRTGPWTSYTGAAPTLNTIAKVVKLKWAATDSQQHWSGTREGLRESKTSKQHKIVVVWLKVLLVVSLLPILWSSVSTSSLQSSLMIGCEYELGLHKHWSSKWDFLMKSISVFYPALLIAHFSCCVLAWSVHI